MTDIFISYKREDRIYAKKIAEQLISKGYKVWWDIELLPGDQFADEINIVLKEAKLIIVLWTPESIQSNWVKSEATIGLKNSTLIPVNLRDAEIPVPFNTLHSLDLKAWVLDQNKSRLNALEDAIAKKIGEPDRKKEAITEEDINIALESPKLEVEYWRSISNSPTQTAKEYQLYIDKYGEEGSFSELAYSRINAIENKKTNKPSLKNTLTILSVLMGIAVGGFTIAQIVGVFDKTNNVSQVETHHVRATVFDAKTCPDTIKTPGSDYLKHIGCIQSWNLGNQNASILAELVSLNKNTSIPVSFRGFQSLDLKPNQKETLRLEISNTAEISNNTCYLLKLTNRSLGYVQQKQYVFLNGEGQISVDRTIEYDIKEKSLETNNNCRIDQSTPKSKVESTIDKAIIAAELDEPEVSCVNQYGTNVDFDGDGCSDRWVNNNNSIFIELDNGRSFPIALSQTWETNFGVWLEGDFDGDSRTDLIQIVNEVVERPDYAHTICKISDREDYVALKLFNFRKAANPQGDYCVSCGPWSVVDANGDRYSDLQHNSNIGPRNIHKWISTGQCGVFEIR